METISIAAIAHEANRALCSAQGDPSQAPWNLLPERQRMNMVAAVQWRLDNPNAPAELQHDAWCKARMSEGWVYGPVLDRYGKIHPLLVPYAEVAGHARAKDGLFISIVTTLARFPEAPMREASLEQQVRSNFIDEARPEPINPALEPASRGPEPGQAPAPAADQTNTTDSGQEPTQVQNVGADANVPTAGEAEPQPEPAAQAAQTGADAS